MPTTNSLVINTDPLLSDVIPVGLLARPSIVDRSGSNQALTDIAVSQPGTLTTLKPNDVYSFSLDSDSFDGNGNINLSLHDISQGDDADLYLYRDTNGNGSLDSSDALVNSSLQSGNVDDSINVRTSAGNYFAQISRYALGSSDDVTYQLDLSASHPSNLLPTDVNVGSLSSGSHHTYHGTIGSSDTSDIFAFSQGSFRQTKITLSNLSNDADIRVIRDINKNKIFDSGDTIVGSSTRGGNLSESIDVNGRGSYLLQTYQYSGDTNYTVKFATT